MIVQVWRNCSGMNFSHIYKLANCKSLPFFPHLPAPLEGTSSHPSKHEGWMNGWMDEWTNGCMDGRMDGWMISAQGIAKFVTLPSRRVSVSSSVTAIWMKYSLQILKYIWSSVFDEASNKIK